MHLSHVGASVLARSERSDLDLGMPQQQGEQFPGGIAGGPEDGDANHQCFKDEDQVPRTAPAERISQV
jgi:hypothetical protein